MAHHIFTLLAVFICWCAGMHSCHGMISPGSNTSDTIAIINCFPFHYEIVLGTVFLANSLGYNVDVYGVFNEKDTQWSVGYRTRAKQGVHALGIFKPDNGVVRLHDCLTFNSTQELITPAAAIFITAQDEVILHRPLYVSALERLKPPVVLAMNHYTTASSVRQGEGYAEMTRLDASMEIPKIFPNTHLVTLSPTTLETLRESLNVFHTHIKTGWLLPILPFAQDVSCTDPEACPFTVQGRIDPTRRGYSKLFRDVQPRRKAMRMVGLHVKLVGTKAKSSFKVPRAVQNYVHIVDSARSYDAYYFEISQSLALVPLSIASHYGKGLKITSTIVVALMTGVPILADRAFQETYSFLPKTAYYLQHDGENVVDAMLRVIQHPAEYHSAVRRSLLEARDKLQLRNEEAVKAWIQGRPVKE